MIANCQPHDALYFRFYLTWSVFLLLHAHLLLSLLSWPLWGCLETVVLGWALAGSKYQRGLISRPSRHHVTMPWLNFKGEKEGMAGLIAYSLVDRTTPSQELDVLHHQQQHCMLCIQGHTKSKIPPATADIKSKNWPLPIQKNLSLVSLELSYVITTCHPKLTNTLELQTFHWRWPIFHTLPNH